MKKFLFAALLLAFSAASCGRVVQRADVGDYVPPTEPPIFQAVEVTESPAEPPTEPPTEGNPPPVEVNPDMPEGYELKNSYVISGFETVLQNPEFPTGCEITALTQTLNFYGFGIDKVKLCDTFMPVDFDGYYTMNQVYLGDPRSTNGFGCNAPVITKVADDYFDYLGSDWYALNLTDISLQEVFYQIEQGYPVVVWSTIGQRETHATFQFRLGCGEDFYFNGYQHCLTIYGFDYDEGMVHVADPMEGNVKYDMARFERIYDEMGKQAVILCGNPESAGEDYSTKEEKKKWLEENKPTDKEYQFGR
jgi:uncharacterized protein YvpB